MLGHRSGLYTGVSQYVEGSKAHSLVVALRLGKRRCATLKPHFHSCFTPGLTRRCHSRLAFSFPPSKSFLLVRKIRNNVFEEDKYLLRLSAFSR
jgi:hypothetical protein